MAPGEGTAVGSADGGYGGVAVSPIAAVQRSDVPTGMLPPLAPAKEIEMRRIREETVNRVKMPAEEQARSQTQRRPFDTQASTARIFTTNAPRTAPSMSRPTTQWLPNAPHSGARLSGGNLPSRMDPSNLTSQDIIRLREFQKRQMAEERATALGFHGRPDSQPEAIQPPSAYRAPIAQTSPNAQRSIAYSPPFVAQQHHGGISAVLSIIQRYMMGEEQAGLQ